MNKKEKTKIIRKTITSLEKVYKDVEPAEPKPVFEQMLQSILSLNESPAGTTKAFELFEVEFVDWNEIRVSAVAEIGRVLKDAGIDPEKARVLKAALGRLFVKKNQLSMDFLLNYQEKKAHDFLKGFPGLPSASLNEIMLLSLGHPFFPVTDKVVKVCHAIDVSDENPDTDELARLLSESIPKKQMLKAYYLFCAYAADVKPPVKKAKKKSPAKKAAAKTAKKAPAKKAPAKKAAAKTITKKPAEKTAKK
jgi:endonuclease III